MIYETLINQEEGEETTEMPGTEERDAEESDDESSL